MNNDEARFEVNDVQYCALRRAMLESRNIDYAIIPMDAEQARRVHALSCRRLASSESACDVPMQGDEAAVMQACAEFEFVRLRIMPHGAVFRCGHSAAGHAAALKDLLAKFPKPQIQ